jgi:hypothetical protein
MAELGRFFRNRYGLNFLFNEYKEDEVFVYVNFLKTVIFRFLCNPQNLNELLTALKVFCRVFVLLIVCKLRHFVRLLNLQLTMLVAIR